jgi:ligand-binding sensor domain-containing protein/serine phosphatase RsbU (regulator of sigma subunit)
MKKNFCLLLLFLLFLETLPLFGQKKNLKFDHFGVNEGLSQSTVDCIMQDSRGFIWIGTRDGLNRYDGYTFTVYKNIPRDSNSLSNNYIKDLVEDKEGNLWIATWGGGLDKFDRRSERFIHYRHNKNNPNTISSDLINSVSNDEKGNLWIGTQDGGLCKLDHKTKSITHFKHNPNDPTSIGDNFVRDILIDSNKQLWIGTSYGGLNLFNAEKNTFTRFQNQKNNKTSLSNNDVWAIFEDNENRLWVATHGGGLNLFNKEKSNFKHFRHDPTNENSIAHDVVMSLEQDKNNNLWIGTENGGITVYNPATEKFHTYKQDDIDNTSLNNNSIYSIFKDVRGNMWIGTYSGGINFMRLDANKIGHYKHNSSPRSLSNNNVTSIHEDKAGNLWIGTDGGGVNLLDRKTGLFRNFKHESGNSESIGGNYILRITEDSEENIWIGTWGDGITIYNPNKNTYKHLKSNPSSPNSLSGNNAWGISEDRDKNMWVGPYFGTGLDLYDKKTGNFKHYKYEVNNQKGISSDIIYTIFEDSKGYLWIGTDGAGVDRLDKKTETFTHFKHIENKNSISNNSVYCIYEDRDGNFWFGTNAGLNFFKTQQKVFTVYTMADGLPNDVIFGILEDEEGNLWLSTNNGISKFNPTTKRFKNFTVADGLQGKEFRSNAFFKGKSGAMYFGGTNGFNEFFPNDLTNESYDPPIVFTDFKIFNDHVEVSLDDKNTSPLKSSITETKSITLPYHASVLSFEFASLNYTVEAKKRYSYMLEGFDEKWNFIGTKRTASYTNLDPGKYTLKVRGLNDEGRWSEKTAFIEITITPPYWKTLWFKLLISCLVIGCFISFYIIKINIVKKQKNILEYEVKERTSEISSQKEELEAQAGWLMEANSKIKEQSENLEKLYEEIKSSIKGAQVIQESILPREERIKKCLPESFVLYKPKDVVSGDFYWFDEKDDKIIIAAVDCTGHGVSGAFMSINGHYLLNQSIYFYESTGPAEILHRLNKSIIKELNQKDSTIVTNDGMDIALCIMNKEKTQLQFAGAKSQVYIVRDNEVIRLEGNKFSIGLQTRNTSRFDDKEIDLRKGDAVYLFSDGYADQIGGENGDEKFLYHRFRDLLISINPQPMDQQLKSLEDTFNNWKKNIDQLDDILVIGIRID